MTAHLNVGNTWDTALLHTISNLNKLADKDVFVDTLYGCTSCNWLGNARSPERLQERSLQDTRNFIEEAHKLDLEIAWTINTSCVGNVNDFIADWKLHHVPYKNMFEYLKPDYLVTANVLVMQMLAKYEINIPIEISTIANIMEPNQLVVLSELGLNITRICLPVGKNRDHRYLLSMSNLCRTLGIEIELIANEFCFLDSCNCEGVFRRSCYDMNAHAKPGDKNDLDFPRGFCTKFREADPANWLRAKWILPQHMALYERDYGISRFKLTGRTHPTSFLQGILPHYMTRNFTGNLLELWPHLQTINQKDFKNAQNSAIGKLRIKSSGLENFFLNIFQVCDSDCSRCDYCKRAFNRLMKLGIIYEESE